MSCRQTIKLVFLSSCLCTATESCIYQYDNCPPETFSIVNNWGDAPDASPEGMAYFFFSVQGGQPWRYDLPGREGGVIDLPDNDYNFLCYNNDTYHVRFEEDHGYDKYVAYTTELHTKYALPSRSVSSSETPVECPDMMWGCSCRHVNLSPLRLEYGNSPEALTITPERILPLAQKQLTARYSFDIYDVKNLDGVRVMSAMCSGLAGAINLACGQKENYPVRMPSAAGRADSTTIAGEFICFGIPEEPTVDNYLSLMVTLTDGRKFNYEFEVSDQIRRSPDPLDVHIKIYGLELEESEPGESTGGFNVGVDNWVNVVINISD